MPLPFLRHSGRKQEINANLDKSIGLLPPVRRVLATLPRGKNNVLKMGECLRQLAETDSDLLLFLNNAHNEFFDVLMICITGKWIWIPLYCSILYLMLRNFSVRTVVACVVAMVVTILLADQIGSSVIRPIVERFRPSNPANPISGDVHIVDNNRGGRFGFPSCHAANTFGLAFFVIYLFRNRVMTVFFLIWATIVSYSRIYLGLHYPGDILAGIVLGLIVASLVYCLARWAVQIKRPSRYLSLHVPWMVGCLTFVAMLGYALYATFAGA